MTSSLAPMDPQTARRAAFEVGRSAEIHPRHNLAFPGIVLFHGSAPDDRRVAVRRTEVSR